MAIPNIPNVALKRGILERMNIPTLLRSSVDPDKISLLFKGLAAVAVLFGIDSTVVANLGNAIVSVITGIGILISAVVAMVGAIRKMQVGRWAAPNYPNN